MKVPSTIGSGKYLAEDKSVHHEVESEGSLRQISGLTNRKHELASKNKQLEVKGTQIAELQNLLNQQQLQLMEQQKMHLLLDEAKQEFEEKKRQRQKIKVFSLAYLLNNKRLIKNRKQQKPHEIHY